MMAHCFISQDSLGLEAVALTTSSLSDPTSCDHKGSCKGFILIGDEPFLLSVKENKINSKNSKYCQQYRNNIHILLSDISIQRKGGAANCFGLSTKVF